MGGVRVVAWSVLSLVRLPGARSAPPLALPSRSGVAAGAVLGAGGGAAAGAEAIDFLCSSHLSTAANIVSALPRYSRVLNCCRPWRMTSVRSAEVAPGADVRHGGVARAHSRLEDDRDELPSFRWVLVSFCLFRVGGSDAAIVGACLLARCFAAVCAGHARVQENGLPVYRVAGGDVEMRPLKAPSPRVHSIPQQLRFVPSQLRIQ